MTFDDLYRQYAGDVRAVAATVAGPDLADDGAQEAFAKLAAKLHRIEGAADVRAWVRMVAHNACRDVVRRHRRRTALDLPMAPGDLAAAAGDRPLASGAAAADPAESVARRDGIARALDAVPPADRRVLVDRLAVGLSYDEIHARTGASDPAMRTSMMRGRRRFAAAWWEQLGAAIVWQARRLRVAFARRLAQLDGLAPFVAAVDRELVAAALALGVVLGGATDNAPGAAPPPRAEASAVPLATAVRPVSGGASLGSGTAGAPPAGTPRRSTSASVSTAAVALGPVAGTADVTRPEPDAGDLTFRVRRADPVVGGDEHEVTVSGLGCDDGTQGSQAVCAVADAFNAIADGS